MERLYVGMDMGSTAAKVVVVNSKGEILHSAVEESEPLMEKQAEVIIKGIKERFPEYELSITATGYGAKLVKEAHKHITEISCHAKGAFFLTGHAGTVIDIGGQDSKVIVVGEGGQVLDFVMNDKCAAGTGRFLENIARRLKLSLKEMEALALSTDEEVNISSTCAVFAESEVISMLARGEDLKKIVRGIHRALVKRVVAMLFTTSFIPPLILSGGVVQNRAIQKMLTEETNERVITLPNPQLTGALGAALLGMHN